MGENRIKYNLTFHGFIQHERQAKIIIYILMRDASHYFSMLNEPSCQAIILLIGLDKICNVDTTIVSW